jgi:hypothetical protein
MTDPNTAFDHQPDPVLGAALRAALTPGDRAAFVARVRARLERPVATPMMDVLARWSRIGIAAAVVAAAAAALVVGRARSEPGSAGMDASSVIAGVQAPDAVTLIASSPDR